ncbi:4848_t:CDS:2 [Ambispora gerdemannii]|uniref:4848_t:CDS:1 n=1 Tax=Ambispora gerdemannii TaxID=144530 RepID=A0A9N9E7J7_9GLOM|nr:4848_t:CDS:2 [Ambispora gerdemannii]
MADERGPIKGSSSSYGAVEDNTGAGKSTSTATAVPPGLEVHHRELHGWRKIKYQFREPFAEFLGTFTFITFGLGGVAQAGGHLNPAVTITLAVFRQFSWLKVPIYITAQTLGAFVAAAAVYSNYSAAISKFDGGNRHVTGQNATAGIFATYPADFLTIPGAFFSEALGTFFLLLVILTVTDERNASTFKSAAPIIIGLTIITIGLSSGWETGFSLNPARDFGPRLFTFFAGYGFEVFSAGKLYFWVPLAAPVVGGLIAGLVYDSLIYTGKSPLNRV